MKILIITVAGSSTRFSKSIGKEVLKCLFYINDKGEALLYRMIHQHAAFDKYIIVGGYKFEELQKSVNDWFPKLKEKIVVVNNPYYADFGSGYSLYCGLQEAIKYDFDSIVFAEGDLFVDEDSYVRVVEAEKSVITCNHDPILANKAVAYYFDLNNVVHYIYDTAHSALEIHEPFLAIYNSGQIWKFANSLLVKKVYQEMATDEWEGTNLIFVENYFKQIPIVEREIISFKNWINCNTVEDFKKIETERKIENENNK